MEVISPGQKVHIVEKLLFENDLRRHFVGQVEAAASHAIRIRGYAWYYDEVKETYIRRAGVRERVMYLGPDMIINIMPQEVDIDAIHYAVDKAGISRITDGKSYGLDLNEVSCC